MIVRGQNSIAPNEPGVCEVARKKHQMQVIVQHQMQVIVHESLFSLTREQHQKAAI